MIGPRTLSPRRLTHLALRARAAVLNGHPRRRRTSGGGEGKGDKGSGTRVACLAMVLKLMESASRRRRTLNSSPLLADVLKGVVFLDGIEQEGTA